MAKLHTNQCRMLELFVRNKTAAQGTVELTDQVGKKIILESGEGFFKWLKIPVVEQTEYDICLKQCEVSLAYLSGCDNILDEGICHLAFNETAINERKGSELAAFYDTPYREQYHFVPYQNWVNDPNGLCWYQGYYHLFYQYNPHGQKWDDVYWGHAASKDLIHWVHLPVVLEPQPNLLGDPDNKGGAFSGCAVVLEDEVVFYLTRHYGPQEDGAQTQEWQTMMRSRDMIHFEPEREVIKEKPPGVGHDFRDPKVTKIGDTWYMVLAGNQNSNSTILLYQSADMENWSFAGPLITEPDQRSTTFECPDFYSLDGKYVALGALMRHHDEYNRYQMTRCYLGEFKNNEFQVEATQWFDFGSDFYAVQSFEHDGRRVAIGWLSDFYGEHRVVEAGAYGGYSIPRELRIEAGRLYMEPVPEIYALKDQKLYEGKENISEIVSGNSYYARVLLKDAADFEIILGQEDDRMISLVREDGRTRIKTQGTKTDNVIFAAEVNEVRQLDIFVDRRTVEVFINKGEAAGTKLFYNSSRNGIFKTAFPNTDVIENISLYTMKSIWQA